MVCSTWQLFYTHLIEWNKSTGPGQRRGKWVAWDKFQLNWSHPKISTDYPRITTSRVDEITMSVLMVWHAAVLFLEVGVFACVNTMQLKSYVHCLWHFGVVLACKLLIYPYHSSHLIVQVNRAWRTWENTLCWSAKSISWVRHLFLAIHSCNIFTYIIYENCILLLCGGHFPLT